MPHLLSDSQTNSLDHKLYENFVVAAVFIVCFSLCFISELAQALDPKAGEKAAEPTAATPEATVFEHTCQSEIRYQWKSMPEASKKIATQPEPKTIFFTLVQTIDSSEELARSKLAATITKTKQSALAECQQLHESSSLCLSKRLQALSDRYDQADFQTRKMLLESAKKDCETQFGDCLSATSSEVTCTKVEKKKEPATPAATDQKAPEADKKGAKKK